MTFEGRTPMSPAPNITGNKTPLKLSEPEFWELVKKLEIQYGLRTPDQEAAQS